jgi:hypothetical protein
MAAAKVEQPISTDVDMVTDASEKDANPLGDRPGDDDSDQDLYTRLKTLQRQLEFYEIQVHPFKSSCCRQHLPRHAMPLPSSSFMPNQGR